MKKLFILLAAVVMTAGAMAKEEVTIDKDNFEDIRVKTKNFQKSSFFNEKRLFEKNALSAPDFKGQKNLHFFAILSKKKLHISNLRKNRELEPIPPFHDFSGLTRGRFFVYLHNSKNFIIFAPTFTQTPMYNRKNQMRKNKKTKCAKSTFFSCGLAQQKQRTQKCSLLLLFNALSNAF